MSTLTRLQEHGEPEAITMAHDLLQKDPELTFVVLKRTIADKLGEDAFEACKTQVSWTLNPCTHWY